MTATLEELETVVAGRQAQPLPRSTRTEEAGAWARFQRETGWRTTPRIAPRRWRDEEGL